MDLLGSDSGDDTLKVNQDFKKKFEHNKRRQLLEQGKLKYGDLLEEDEESSESEDSEGALVNPKFEEKFLKVMTAIRESDKSILKDEVWKDEDFEYTSKEAKAQKKVTLKDQIRQDALKKMDG